MINRKDIICIYMVDNQCTKARLFEFFKLFDRKYYQELFSEDMQEDELPDFVDGQYGEYSPDILADLKDLETYGYVERVQRQNFYHTSSYLVYQLTDAGEQWARETGVMNLTEWQRVGMMQMKDELRKAAKDKHIRL